MSLPSPLSVGDIVLLGQIAWKVTRALSSGSRSSQAEFAKVQTLANSLTESLDLLVRELTGPIDVDSVVGADTSRLVPVELSNILTGCRDGLKQLEEFVERYSLLDEETAERGGQWGRQARGNVKRTWKKIMWTTEGGEISKLTQTLVAHTNSLQLAVSIVNGQVQVTTIPARQG